MISKILIISALIVFIVFPVIAQEEEEASPLLDQIESHMSVLETKFSAISSATDAETQKTLYAQYFQELDNHMNLMSQMANSERSLGLKSSKRRMQYRINALLSQIKTAIGQMKSLPEKLIKDN
ncbi:MAG: hypothetical protein ABII18_12620 [bacterium]